MCTCITVFCCLHLQGDSEWGEDAGRLHAEAVRKVANHIQRQNRQSLQPQVIVYQPNLTKPLFSLPICHGPNMRCPFSFFYVHHVTIILWPLKGPFLFPFPSAIILRMHHLFPVHVFPCDYIMRLFEGPFLFHFTSAVTLKMHHLFPCSCFPL